MQNSIIEKLYKGELRIKKDNGLYYDDWTYVKFDELFIEFNQKNIKKYNQYTAGKYGLKLIGENIKYDITNHKEIHPNTLVIGIGIDEIGISNNIYGCVSPIYSTYNINQKVANSIFISYFLKKQINEQKDKTTQKSTRREYELNNKELNKMLIKIPNTLEEQQKIVNLLSTFKKLLDNEFLKIIFLKQLNETFLNKMFC